MVTLGAGAKASVSDTIHCSECGALIPEDRVKEPCPECGSLQRTLSAHLTDHVVLSDILTNVLVREGGGGLKAAETNRVTKRKGERAEVTSIAAAEGNQVEYELRGQPAQNEEGVEEVLARLTRHLSAGEAGWMCEVRTPTARGEEGIDGDVYPPEGRGRPIPVQVTRPVPSDKYMQAAVLGSNTSASGQPRELVDHLLKAVKEKQRLSGRHEVTLALDAVSLVQVVLPQVIKAAKGEVARFDSVGFSRSLKKLV